MMIMSLFLGPPPPPPPPPTQHTGAKRPAAPTHECTGPASTGRGRIATEEKGRVSRNHYRSFCIDLHHPLFLQLQTYTYPWKPTRVVALSPRASLGRRTVCGRTEQRRPPVLKRYETKVRMVWGSVLIAAAALKTSTRKGYNAQGWPLQDIRLVIRRLCTGQYYSWHSAPPFSHPTPAVCCNQYCAIYGFPSASLFRHSTYHIGSCKIV